MRPSRVQGGAVKRRLSDVAAEDADSNDPIDFWVKRSRWPGDLFEPDLGQVLARGRSSSASSRTPSDHRPQEEKSVQYRDPRYETLLATKGCFMDDSELGVSNESKLLYRNLLERNQPHPENSLFRDDIFDLTCRKLRNKNEARIVQDISRLIVPSAETLATYGAKHLDILTESVSEGWGNSIPLTGTRPQPHYSVGFSQKAFTKEQLDKLSPFIGNILTDVSYFLATNYMYFPFLACEVQSGTSLDIADRRNAHAMFLAARGVAELFRLVGRQDDGHRRILAFSVSYNRRSVRIHGYYPVFDGKDTKYYSHLIHEFDFTTLDGRDKWVAYRFTKNIYDTWMPDYFKSICSAIDQLPADRHSI